MEQSEPDKIPWILHQWEIDYLKSQLPDWDGKQLGGRPVMLPRKITAMDMIRDKIRQTKPKMMDDND